MQNEQLCSTLEQLPKAVCHIYDLLQKQESTIQSLLEETSRANELLITGNEACQCFVPAISRLTLRNWTDAGKVKSYRIGGRVYYKRSEVIESAKHLKKFDYKKN